MQALHLARQPTQQLLPLCQCRIGNALIAVVPCNVPGDALAYRVDFGEDWFFTAKTSQDKIGQNQILVSKKNLDGRNYICLVVVRLKRQTDGKIL